jgi:hypothetical protein
MKPTRELKAEPTLEQRGVAALKADIGSDDLASLIAQTGEAITVADRTAAVEKERALEPGCPDAKAARQAMEDATFASNRLRTLLSRLQARHQQVCEKERQQEWLAQYFSPLDKAGDDLAQELADFARAYRDCATRGVNLFERITSHNERVMSARSRQPDGMDKVLQSVESSVLEKVRLFDWDGKEIWPPQVSIAAAYAATMSPGHDPRYSGDWWQTQKQDQERSAANAAKWEKEEAARQAEEKRRFEVSFRQGRQA